MELVQAVLDDPEVKRLHPDAFGARIAGASHRT
jgi:hypothetical protein